MNGQDSKPGLSASDARQGLRSSALGVIDRIKGQRSVAAVLDEGKTLVQTLRDTREFDLLDQLTGELRRAGAADPAIRLLQAQSYIERGKSTLAIDVLEGPAASLPKDSIEWSEAHGLMGRAWKQVLFDTGDHASEIAQNALRNAVEQYSIPYENDPVRNVWQGLNLMALSHFAESKGLSPERGIDAKHLAREIIGTLKAIPESKRDRYYHASLAEASLALDDIENAQEHIRAYVTDPKTTAFALGGTLRQFTELWELDRKSERGKGIVQSICAALMQKDFGRVDLAPDQLQRLSTGAPSDQQLESILGPDGPISFQWWKVGLDHARSVGVICQGEPFRRVGTGFLIRGGDFRPAWGDELFVLTNAHVVSDNAQDGALARDEACIKFEAVDANVRYDFESIVWSSPKTELDATILRLKQPVAGFKHLPAARNLPIADGKQRVYVIGYPGGGDLSFSFQDNILLEHEGPTTGHPVDPRVCRVQYRAPTEGGSSGSPVFNGNNWRVIALHHAGGNDMRRLNGSIEKWPANQGIWIQSIVGGAK
jgi:S1-C subfamily serine protease